jgi:hypothetical protein
MVTIDTEEDDWGTYHPFGASVENIARLRELKPLWDRYGVRPTYLVNHPPMADRKSARILADLAADGTGEFGVHCHPWNSPPLTETDGPPITMMNRLSEEENHAKLLHLTDCFSEMFCVRPRSFRAGRWGLGASVSRALLRLGYDVDSSVSPFVDWSPEGGPDYSRSGQVPYFINPSDPLSPARDGAMVEVPTSVGFLWGPQGLAASVREALENSPAARMKIVGLLDLMGPLAKRWLSPETSTLREMIRLSRALVHSGVRVLDFTFHSPSLLPGATPFVPGEPEKARLLGRIQAFLDYCYRQGYRFATLSEVADSVRTEKAL